VFLIDTGMLSSYYTGGRPSALEICGGAKFIAVYMDEQVVLLDSAGPSPQNGGLGERPAVRNGATAPEKLEVLPPNRICSTPTATPQ